MDNKMRVKIHVPVVQYGFIEVDGTVDDLDEMVGIHNKYSCEGQIKVSESGWEIIDTFTGEKIRYNDVLHAYTDMTGKKLMSGSEYKKRLEKPFNKDFIAPKVAKKYGISDSDVLSVWSSNAKASTMWGDSIHYAMEHYFSHKKNGCDEKEYHVANPPLLRKIVQSFPALEANIIPEVVVSAVKLGMVGRLDALNVIDMNKKVCRIGDYKTDADLTDAKLDAYFDQLSFYAHIMIKHGWEVQGLDIWNICEEWTTHSQNVKELKSIN